MTERWENWTPNDPPRAQRFAIQMPLRYRRSGEVAWHEGKTENISRSGVLFQAEELLEMNTPVELSFALPVEVGGEAGAVVFCQSQIVRTVLPPATDARPALAALIRSYEFLRGPDAPDA